MSILLISCFIERFCTTLWCKCYLYLSARLITGIWLVCNDVSVKNIGRLRSIDNNCLYRDLLVYVLFCIAYFKKCIANCDTLIRTLMYCESHVWTIFRVRIARISKPLNWSAITTKYNRNNWTVFKIRYIYTKGRN